MRTPALLLFLFLATTLTGQRITRIEPPHWWVGMHNPQVQLLVYGENIAHLMPVISYHGITITASHRLENPNYLFVDLRIAEDALPGVVQIQFYRDNQEITHHPWSLESREAGSADREGIDQSDVIYLITPDRFANGDPSNDTVEGMSESADRSKKGGRHGGDLAGIKNHLSDIKDMGFTALWLNPVLENNMRRGSYHGYATTDYYRVDPRFGTNALWRDLVRESRALGIKHIMDVIPNHCGSEHWWMSDLPVPDWLNQWDTFTMSNHLKTAVSDPYATSKDIKAFTDGWFVRSMPDLNQRNPFLATYLTQNAIWWIEYLGLAGLRIDTYPYADTEFISRYCKAILDEYPNLFIVGEQWHTIPAIVAYWQKDKVNPDGYVSHLPVVMDFPLQAALVRALTEDGGWHDDWLPVYETLGQDFLYPHPQNILVFADNHDMSRIFTRVNENEALFKLAMTFILTTRGIPQIFYGTEILMSHPGTDEHVVIRSDFPGGWDGDALNAFTGLGLSPSAQKARTFIRSLLHWRMTADAIHFGRLMHYAPKDDVYVYFRYHHSQKVMVILNKNPEPYTLNLSRFGEMLAGVSSGRDVTTGKIFQMDSELAFAGPDALVLELH